MSGLRAAIERLERAVASGTERVEIIDPSGLTPWTPANWPPWRYPALHPLPPGFGTDAVPDPKPDAPGGTPDAR